MCHADHRDLRRRAHRAVPRLREPRDRRPRRPRGEPVRLRPGRRRAGRARPGGGAAGVRRLVGVRRGPTAHGPGPGRAHRDPAAARRLAEERRRHQDGGRRDRAGVRAQLHHDVRDRHRRLRLHPARPQAAGDGQAGDRHRRAVVDLEAAPARLRRVPVLRPAARRRASAPPEIAPVAARRRGGGPGRRAAGHHDAGRARPAHRRSRAASRLKRAVLRKDPTFDEADHGFRGFGELLRNLEGRGRGDCCARAARRATPRSRSPRTTRPTTTRSRCSWTSCGSWVDRSCRA